MTPTDVEEALRAWPHQPDVITPLIEGVNSTTWLVDTADGAYVAKLVDDLDAPGLIKSLQVAEFLAERGLPSGAPLRTSNGELTISLPEGTLALLRREPGRPPDVSVPSQVRRAGRLLAHAHLLLRDYPADSDEHYQWPWEWVDRLLTTIAMPEHVSSAARRLWPQIIRTVEDHRLSVSVIHGDPGLGGYLLTDGDQTGALIDWTTAMRGPLVYDLASVAVMTRRAGPQVAEWFIDGYVDQLPEIRPQLAYLDDLIRARWLANAIYFASRIERGVERGSDSATMNEDGLAEAYAGMTASA